MAMPIRHGRDLGRGFGRRLALALGTGMAAWVTPLAPDMALAQEAPADAAAEVDDATDNAVTEASDAFGTQSGSERTGLYSSMEIRGFNPVDAGNARIEGLYYDEVVRLTPRLTDSTTIKVGFGAQGYAFPAPTGLVDYALQRPGDERGVQLDVSTRLNGNAGGSLELRWPGFLPKTGLFMGAGLRNRLQADGRRSNMRNVGALAQFGAVPDVELSIFGLVHHQSDEEARPLFYSAGDYLPPRIKRGRDISQPWADKDEQTRVLGLIARAPLGDFRVESGLFYNGVDEASRFADLLTGIDEQGNVAERVIVADGDRFERSWSGEMRLVRPFAIGKSMHQLALSLRGRRRHRNFGGDQRISLGPSTILARDLRERPTYSLGPKNDDLVEQFFYGVAYAGRIGPVALDAGVSKVDYSKRIEYADPARPPLERTDDPIAWNLAGYLDLTSRLTAMASVARGMEEALVAPDRAVNRSETPAAIRIRQEEAGLRYAIGDELTVLAGVFRIAKPYYNLDAGLNYRLLGTIVNKGVELSLVARPIAGMTILGGAVLSDPVIEGEAVTLGLIGPRPIGMATSRIIGNLDWRFDGGEAPLSIDVALAHRSRRVVNASNSLSIPANRTINFGFRYRFDIGDAAMVLRGRLENVFDSYGWDVTPGGGLSYEEPRNFTIQLIADF